MANSAIDRIRSAGLEDKQLTDALEAVRRTQSELSVVNAQLKACSKTAPEYQRLSNQRAALVRNANLARAHYTKLLSKTAPKTKQKRLALENAFIRAAQQFLDKETFEFLLEEAHRRTEDQINGNP